MQLAAMICFAALASTMLPATAPAAELIKESLSEIERIDDGKAILGDVRGRKEWQEDANDFGRFSQGEGVGVWCPLNCRIGR